MEIEQKLAEVKSGTTNMRRFLFVFSLPFLLVGLGTAYFFFSKVFGSEGFSSNLIPVLVFAVIFTSAGLFLMFKVPKLLTNAVEKIEKRVEAEKSGKVRQPWLENPDWAKGKIECSNQGAMYGVWIFAVIWCAVSFIATYEPLMTAYQHGQYSSAFIALFPLIGVFLVILAIMLTVRWRKFGSSIFEVSNQTGYVGGELKGVIRTASEVAATGDFSLKLKCVERITTGSGKSRSTTSHTRWEQEKKIPSGGASSRMGIPVSFSVPGTCLETDDDSAVGTVLWTLAIQAPVKGVDYSAEFTVPVFKKHRE